ncbi:hypothetical protein MYX07_06875 [Patescibacteria group bacterium AH-259-L07]|nr:hypothetical protein [Patescibacteria group bacterium AH-259-L07]
MIEKFEGGIPPQKKIEKVEQPKVFEHQPIERIEFEESPLLFDVKKTAETFFPEGKHLKIANGNEYILNEDGNTILLFENRQDQGFSSVYTPLTPSELKAKLTRLPEEERKRLFDIFGITDDTPVVAQSQVITKKPAFDMLGPLTNSSETPTTSSIREKNKQR